MSDAKIDAEVRQSRARCSRDPGCIALDGHLGDHRNLTETWEQDEPPRRITREEIIRREIASFVAAGAIDLRGNLAVAEITTRIEKAIQKEERTNDYS